MFLSVVEHSFSCRVLIYFQFCFSCNEKRIFNFNIDNVILYPNFGFSFKSILSEIIIVGNDSVFSVFEFNIIHRKPFTVFFRNNFTIYQ